jgi:isoleucyl-tRNA synthetase
MNTQTPQNYYPEVNPKPSFPEIEKRILAFWQERSIFQKSVDGGSIDRNGGNEFVFYDGPPFANGLPHYGHLLTGYVKDIVPRYQTLRGKKVDRRFGWDCHGLPAEMAAEKELQISGKNQITEYGIDRFNSYCRSSVLKYSQEWETYVTRQARWVDFINDYKTMDLSFMESVIWAFKQLWEKGLIYESYRVVPYSWAAESILSNFETRLDNSYRQRQDPAITVSFALLPKPGDELPIKLLAWTTTPWTLPSNLALAVGKNIEYAVMEKDGIRYILGAAALPKYEKELENARRVGAIAGQELVGRTYQPIFPFFQDTANAFQVLAADFVNTEEGTGIVHLAPGFGEDDWVVCQENEIPVICPVDNSGRFTPEVPLYQGKLVFDANKEIIRDLKQSGKLLKNESYLHNYPHCWRTDEPLIYKAVSSWYVRVTAFRDRMVELNKEINWMPTHIRDGLFGNWLEGARDWSISRNRFWGAPIPVWKSDDPNYPRLDVYGSLDEIERDFGVRPQDLHRPFIDRLVRPNPDDPTGKSMMRRVEDVFDCWFESGSMPFAQVHYPFENQEWFENHFPGDFIVEYIAQTRGWFYTLMVLGTALFDKPPFRNCLCHGVVLDENGQKLSKRLRNYPDPEAVFQTYGADALRWFLVSSPILRGGDLQIDREGKGIAEIVRRVINPIWSAYYFFCLYANTDGIKAELRTDASGVLDRYIIAKTRNLVVEITQKMDTYDIPGACAIITNYIDVLNNWYIRRSRDRFWKHERDRDKQDAYNTLFTVLHILCRVISPLMPLISEEIYKGLTGEESVHLSNWPDPDFLPANVNLVEEMDLVRDICSTALSIRETYNLRIRLPLTSLIFAKAGIKKEMLLQYVPLIRDEVNVKEVQFEADTDKFGKFELKVKGSTGVRLKADMPKVMTAARNGEWKLLSDNRVEVAGNILEVEEFTMQLKAREGITGKLLNSHDGVAILDVKLTPELEQEGIARDLVRLIQMTRKEAGLNVSDRIQLFLNLPAALVSAIEAHKQYICDETLAEILRIVGSEAEMEAMYVSSHQIQGEGVTIAVMKN